VLVLDREKGKREWSSTINNSISCGWQRRKKEKDQRSVQRRRFRRKVSILSSARRREKKLSHLHRCGKASEHHNDQGRGKRLPKFALEKKKKPCGREGERSRVHGKGADNFKFEKKGRFSSEKSDPCGAERKKRTAINRGPFFGRKKRAGLLHWGASFPINRQGKAIVPVWKRATLERAVPEGRGGVSRVPRSLKGGRRMF